MCFSAPASFAAAAVLAGVSAATLAQKPALRLVPFAVFPAVFAVHQAIEGFIWLSFGRGAEPPGALVAAYLVIAQILWPSLTPLAMLLIEGGRRRRHALFALQAAGLLVSATMAYILINHPYTVSMTAHGLRYVSTHAIETHIVGLYVLTTTAPLLISRRRYILALGITILIGSAITELFYFRAAASVWCFFAAIASVFVFLHVRRAGRLKRAEAFSGKVEAGFPSNMR